MSDDLYWILALLIDIGIRLERAFGLANLGIAVHSEMPHINLISNPQRHLKTSGNQRADRLLGAPL